MSTNITNILSFSCSFSDDGAGTASLQYASLISVNTSVAVNDDIGRTMFTGVVRSVASTEIGTGYTMELADPLSLGLSGTFDGGTPVGFPTGGTREEIQAWCDRNDRKYAYKPNGHYELVGAGSSRTIAESDLKQRSYLDPSTRGGYFNRIVVTGDVEKEIEADEQTVTQHVDGYDITETFQADRMISRSEEGSDLDKTEEWEWDERNICTKYKCLERTPAQGVFKGSWNEVETTRVVQDCSDDISAYRISQEVVTREMGSVILGLQESVAALKVIRREETAVGRNNDGSGFRETVAFEAARNKYNSTFNMPIYSEETGEKIGERQVTMPLFDFYDLLPSSRERTRYSRRRGRPVSVTRTWEGKLVAGAVSGSGMQGSVMTFSPTGSSAGRDEPEQPEMEEAVETIRASVEYVYPRGSVDTGYTRNETLPVTDEDIPGNIEESADLQRWLESEVQQFAAKRFKTVTMVKESSIDIRLDPAWEIGDSFNGYKVFAISHTLSPDTATTTLSGEAPSSAAPPRAESSVGSLLVNTMSRLDRGQDNIRNGRVKRPISSRRALVSIDGEDYKTDNPNGGYVYAGDDTRVYRPTGSSRSGRST